MLTSVQHIAFAAGPFVVAVASALAFAALVAAAVATVHLVGSTWAFGSVRSSRRSRSDPDPGLL